MASANDGTRFCVFQHDVEAIEEFLTLAPHEQFKELIVIAVTSIGMLLAIEPILERIGPVRVHDSFRREDDILIRAAPF